MPTAPRRTAAPSCHAEDLVGLGRDECGSPRSLPLLRDCSPILAMSCGAIRGTSAMSAATGRRAIQADTPMLPASESVRHAPPVATRSDQIGHASLPKASGWTGSAGMDLRRHCRRVLMRTVAIR